LKENLNNLKDNGNEENSIPAVDEQELNEVTEIIRLLSKTISTIKIFHADHTTVKNQITDLWGKLDPFLEKNQTLEINIQEYSFTYKNNPVFQDKKTIKSLPFLLYKDGMQTLSFYNGLKKEELQGFMGIIKNVYELPSEESDIVNLLWEKDFANIRYFAPDEFLETKIGVGKEPADISVDKEALFSGSIELLPEDRAELLNDREEPDILEQTITENQGLWENTEFIEQTLTLTEQENRILEAMLTANRQVTPEDELVLLITEMLNLEEDSERFKTILDAIADLHKDLVQKGDFTRAYQLLSNAMEIKIIASYESGYKESLVQGFLNKLKNDEIEELIKKPLLEDKVTDFRLLFAYLDLLLEADAISLLADLYEKINKKEFRKGSLDYFKEKATRNPEILTRIVDDSKIKLTREVIEILSSIPEKRAIQGFAVFIQSKNKTIKTNAIKKLAKFKDETSSKILFGFLNDTDEKIRILAAHKIPVIQDNFMVEQVIQTAMIRNFKNKSKQEKQSILDILGKDKTKKAYSGLEKIIGKVSFFSGTKNVETGLCAIQTLKEINSPESRRILKNATQSKNRKIKEASGSVLKNLSLPKDQKK
jgi:hypothetical protein